MSPVSFHDIPTLSLDALESQDAKSEGLRLIADSVSEMRPRAAKAVVFHPLCLAAMAASWLALHRLVYASDPEKDAARALMLASGITMLYVAAVRFVSCGYVKLADRIGLDWLRAEYGGERDVILGARVGDSLVGALVLRLESKGPAAASPKRKSRSRSRCRSRSVSLKGGKGIIRAWTVAPKHRGQGVGRDLLNEAVRLTRDRCGKDAQVGFAQQHAHSVMIMPSMFNKSFRRDEARAAKALDVAVAEWDVTRKKKR
ncbi:hypothetical protein UVI_02036040 [Ustilaginoidea virens]|uniref:N-acetyltransferase domain-containing protein n=1 Tax=Ustilaginoidea virens TaxID=1159556 RepID=A0A1B5L6B7_USTVR|nr:hypothetical protein UVI_02036040 [Ustilaginoidea virens]